MAKKVFAGGKVDRLLWLRFVARAKRQGKTVAEALEELVRESLSAKKKAA